MKKVFLLDPGHGGIIDEVYQTEGKRSPVWEDGSQLFEGEFNRDVVRCIMGGAELFGVNCVNLVPEEEDISLSMRVQRANKYWQEHPEVECIYVSVHANAGGGHGIEVFTSPGFTRSDDIATVFLNKLGMMFPEARKRVDMSDGDPDKEANFYVLKKTAMAAILTENFFMDNEMECRKHLMSETGRNAIALAHIAAMVELNREA